MPKQASITSFFALGGAGGRPASSNQRPSAVVEGGKRAAAVSAADRVAGSEGAARARDGGGPPQDTAGRDAPSQIEKDGGNAAAADRNAVEGDDTDDGDEVHVAGGRKRRPAPGRRAPRRKAAKKAVILSDSESDFDAGDEDDEDDDESVVVSDEDDDDSGHDEDEDLDEDLDFEEETKPRGRSSRPSKSSGPKAVKKQAPAPAPPRRSSAGTAGSQPSAPLAALSTQASSAAGDALSSPGAASYARFAGRYDADEFSFMWERNRADAERRRPSDEGFDETTIHVPASFLSRLPPAQAQWWRFKAAAWDSVMLFKMGKFYEMFEMDAHIGAEDLNLLYMKDERPHVGFPEKSYTAYAERLVRKGHRVEVVEQVETPAMLQERNLARRKKGLKNDTVVRRQKVAVLTRGTHVEDAVLCSEHHGGSATSHLLVLWEMARAGADGAAVAAADIGACLIDAATRRIEVGAVRDTESTRPELRALVSRAQPVEVVTLGAGSGGDGAMSPETRKCLESCLRPDVLQSRRLNRIAEPEGILYLGENQADADCGRRELQAIIDGLSGADGDSPRLRRAALSALVFSVSYLQECMMDAQVFSNPTLIPLYGAWGCPMRGVLPGIGASPAGEGAFADGDGGGDGPASFMDLDASAIMGMELLETEDGSASGSLLSLIDCTSTPFGKRLMRRWICSPLSSADAIERRQRAIRWLRGAGRGGANHSMYSVAGSLKKVADLERVLSRLQSIDGGRNASHVVLYEDSSKQRLGLLLAALRGFARVCASLETFSATGAGAPRPSSDLVDTLLCPAVWAAARSSIEEFRGLFDWEAADREGRIVPEAEGVDEAFDAAEAKVREVNGELSALLEKVRSQVGSRDIVFVSVGKDSHLLHIADRLVSRLPRSFEKASKIKGFARYMTPELKALVADLEVAQEERQEALEGVMRSIVDRFLSKQDVWKDCVRRAAQLDVLISLAVASESMEETGPTCTPTFLPPQAQPTLRASELRHPCVAHILASAGSGGSRNFVPNDVSLGGAGAGAGESPGPRVMLLTGPNMGGKSTTLRMVAMASVMAHLGMDVPASAMELTTCDRIFVRMGAQDNILAGQSTFLVELSETASVLNNATERSLVILDELGRGTSTSDGNAIAHAVLRHLIAASRCLTLFSTHYHRLVDETSSAAVQLQHMQLEIDGAAAGRKDSTGAAGPGADEDDSKITFLYKLRPGHCPKSYGMNVARLSGIPREVVANAQERAKIFKDDAEAREAGAKFMSSSGSIASLVKAARAGDFDVLRSLRTSSL